MTVYPDRLRDVPGPRMRGTWGTLRCEVEKVLLSTRAVLERFGNCAFPKKKSLLRSWRHLLEAAYFNHFQSFRPTTCFLPPTPM